MVVTGKNLDSSKLIFSTYFLLFFLLILHIWLAFLTTVLDCTDTAMQCSEIAFIDGNTVTLDSNVSSGFWLESVLQLRASHLWEIMAF